MGVTETLAGLAALAGGSAAVTPAGRRAARQGLARTPRTSEKGVDALAPLSERERDVLHLVAEGLTNVEVAERLFLSPRTVHAHLYRIYNKLGVSTRAAATRIALEQGLV
jgi:DNA-binding NarL/FixJ family response regulator